MRIAINASNFLLKDELWNEMVETLFTHLGKDMPDHQFFFITETNKKQIFSTSTNVSTIVLSNPLNNRWSLKVWHDYKLPALLTKHKIDVLISADSICSLRCHVPQVVLVKELVLQQVAKKKAIAKFATKRFLKSLVKSKGIVVFNESEKKQLLDKYPLGDAKITIANLFANTIFQPKEWQDKELIKDKYSEGKEYFLYNIEDSKLIDPLVILKSFSLFKKRQQSNMQLLIVGEMNTDTENLTAKLNTYKYKSEVKILHIASKNEMANVVAAAYCFIHFSNVEKDLPIMNAMQAGVPAIVLKTDFTNEITADIALQADANSSESIAEQMKIIYKDENLRSKIVLAGLQIANDCSIENTASQIWSTILSALE